MQNPSFDTINDYPLYNNYLHDELMTAVNQVNNIQGQNHQQDRLYTVEEDTSRENSYTLNDSRLPDQMC